PAPAPKAPAAKAVAPKPAPKPAPAQKPAPGRVIEDLSAPAPQPKTAITAKEVADIIAAANAPKVEKVTAEQVKAAGVVWGRDATRITMPDGRQALAIPAGKSMSGEIILQPLNDKGRATGSEKRSKA